ncbi:hypothetical protein pdam_00024700 [Pocillopora damicornis]|uniref:Uncharacterized protein n=1 Tax=Pocillopora damicornis TaxID=46731 RepID=A0A3M6V664_POCDA|nr:hypothetical protein pdam_00024700 [Pocillopora damicornis]
MIALFIVSLGLDRSTTSSGFNKKSPWRLVTIDKISSEWDGERKRQPTEVLSCLNLCRCSLRSCHLWEAVGQGSVDRIKVIVEAEAVENSSVIHRELKMRAKMGRFTPKCPERDEQAMERQYQSDEKFAKWHNVASPI